VIKTHDELFLKNVKIVDSKGISEDKDIHIKGGKIYKIGNAGQIKNESGDEIDGKGLLALPGLIDAHFHAGLGSIKSTISGFKSESRAAIAGGFTSVRAHLIIGEDGKEGYTGVIDEIIQRTREVSLVDFTYNPMIGTERTIHEMNSLIKKGINSFKIYYSAYKGEEGKKLGMLIDENISQVVYRAMEIAAQYKQVRLIFHAEDGDLVNLFTDRMKRTRSDDSQLELFSNARPPIAEKIKINEIGTLSEYLGTKVHIAHVSSKMAFQAANGWKAKGVNISLETEPHYLLFDNSMWHSLGVYGKVNPPLRTPEDRAFMIQMVANRRVDSISTDTNPFTRQQKENGTSKFGNIWRANPGFDNIQLVLPLLITEFVATGKMTVSTLVWAMSERPSKLFSMESKGKIAVDKDADIVLLDLNKSTKVVGDVLENVPGKSWLIYENRHLVGFPELVLRRGQLVYDGHKVKEGSKGEFLAAR
jgi:dihydroorotase (multifunctional complex type)